MKKLLIILLFLMFECGISYALDNSEYSWQSNSNKTYDINSGSQIGNTYYSWDNKTQTYNSYTQQNNHIYGSDGSHYYRMDNTVQDMNSGSTYQINGNTVNQMY